MPDRRLFVFTAGNPAARSHLDDSIISPIDWSENSQYWSGEARDELAELDARIGLYAWGAVPGRRNEPTWRQMEPGDWVLCAYDNAYHYVAQVETKHQNRHAAEAVWGLDPSGNTWEYMYFLSKPAKIDVPIDHVSQHLYPTYRGFTLFTDSKLEELERQFGSIDAFVATYFQSTAQEWESFIDTMSRYQLSGIVFQSIAQGHQYFVSHVDDSRCQVERVSANEPAQVTFSSYESALKRLREAGGELRFSDLNGTVAVRTCFLQGAELSLSADRQTVRILDNLSDVENAFSEFIAALRVDRSGGHPKLYKPALIETLIRGIDDGRFSENEFSFDALSPLVLDVFERRGIDGSETQVAMAYFHLASDLFWMHAYRDPSNPISSTPSPGILRSRIKYAVLKNSFWQVLQNASSRRRLLQELESNWFNYGTEQMQYFLIRSNSDSDYGDVLGQQYAYHNRVQNSQKLKHGGKIIVDRKERDGVYFQGYGAVAVASEEPDEEGRTKYVNPYTEWKLAAEKRPVNPEIKSVIRSVENFNDNFSILPLDKETYEKLVNYIDEGTGPTPPPPVLEAPLNQILFGPPGTGKTYITRKIAVQLADPEWYQKMSGALGTDLLEEAVAKRYRDLERDQRIVFTTFHQSFGYEDFIEGIRANTDDESGNIRYDLEPGIFRQLVERAEQSVGVDKSLGLSAAPKVWKISIGRANQRPILDYCLEHGEARVGWNGLGDLNVPYEDRSDAEREKWDTMNPLNRKPMEDFAESVEVGDVFLCFKTRESIQAVGIVESDYYYDSSIEGQVEPYYPQTRKVKWIVKGVDLNIVSINKNKKLPIKTFSKLNRISWESISQLLIEKGLIQPQNTASRYNHVLIIDEINRGNISRIFGELITLLEPSKRSGGADEREVVLPYSKENFSIPPNLYVLGTMNTADKSLTQMDIALRRRFVFVEMPPRPDLLNGTTVHKMDLGDLLSVINQRIEVLLDRDHLIGHSYFLEIINLLEEKDRADALAGIFRQSIIPLLQEYFFEDWERAGLYSTAHNRAFAKNIVALQGSTLALILGPMLDRRSFIAIFT